MYQCCLVALPEKHVLTWMLLISTCVLPKYKARRLESRTDKEGARAIHQFSPFGPAPDCCCGKPLQLRQGRPCENIFNIRQS